MGWESASSQVSEGQPPDLLPPSRQWLGAVREWLLVLKNHLPCAAPTRLKRDKMPDKGGQEKAKGFPHPAPARDLRCSAARMSSEVMEAADNELMLYPEAVGKGSWGYLLICTKAVPPLLQNHRWSTGCSHSGEMNWGGGIRRLFLKHGKVVEGCWVNAVCYGGALA